jgi:hypothetical protein
LPGKTAELKELLENVGCYCAVDFTYLPEDDVETLLTFLRPGSREAGHKSSNPMLVPKFKENFLEHKEE